MGLRKGPAGKGKYYTQIHGDSSYNRRKNKNQTRQYLNESEDLKEDYPNKADSNRPEKQNNNPSLDSLLE